MRDVLVELMLESLVWPAGLVALGLDEDVGEVTLGDAAAVAAGFLVVVVVVELAAGFGFVPGELAEVALDKVEVRRAAVPRVEVLRLFSSSEADA